jgi:uncharacterized membrane protein SpoIIM required for sporulation
MTTLTKPLPFKREDLRLALVIARREVRDSFRDWRIIIPIFLLTLIFPAIMNFTAARLVDFVEDFGAELIATQLIPFLLLVVGFFPMSFSLIIALETFVGEKERKSMEPLLATPLSNRQLYAGKMVAALVPPLSASYAGMGVYMLGLWLTIGWQPSLQLFVQTILLTTIQGIIMVAGAVVVSSQATSVRAANLLASFIIVPMALLIQFEAAALFWGNHDGLWWLILGLAITAVLLIRMGIFIFNREELLGRDIDQIRLGWMFRLFWRRYSGRDEDGRYPKPALWYKQTLAIVPELKKPAAILLVGLVAAAIFGVFMAHQYQLSPELRSELTGTNMMENLAGLQVFLSALPLLILYHNIRAILLQSVLGVFTLGVLGVLIFMLPWSLISYVATQFYMAGENPAQFLLATIAPHAIVELPALLLIAAAGLRWQAVTIAKPPDRALSEVFLMRAGDYGRVLIGLGMPLLIIAALLESFVTPLVLFRVYGG